MYNSTLSPPIPLSSDLTTSWILDHLQNHQAVWLKVNGHSMRPYINQGEWVLLNPNALPRRGDLVLLGTFSPPHLLYIHRVHWISQNYFWTKGDSLPFLDSPQPHSTVLAKVVSIRSVNPSGVDAPSTPEELSKLDSIIWRYSGLIYSWFYTLTVFMGIRYIGRWIKRGIERLFDP